MTENETPLYQIILQRFTKASSDPPDWAVGGQKSSDSLARNWLAVLRAGLLTVAAFLAVQAYPPDLVKAWKWIKENLPGYENHEAWYLAALLALAAFQGHWLCSVWLRFVRYCKKTSFAPLAIIAGVAIGLKESAISTGTSGLCATGWAIIGWGLFFVAVASRFWTSEELPDEIQDKLQRSYFVDRLMECFLSPGTSLRRIAILGGWGTGKTVVLRLIRQRLRKNTNPEFGVAMINPWAAQSIEEVHSMITRAFEEALGYRDYFNTPSLLSRWLSSLTSLKFGGNTELGFDLQQLFRGDSSSREDQLVRRINETLRASGRICIILVDDMERAEPKVIRRAFPLIDLLRQIEHCFFVFGIDPVRVARAFKERSASSEQTKGYLDKVFDLQINLPPLRERDIANLCKDLVKQSQTPKLYAAWDSISSHLPTIPRDAIHFVRDAIMRETLFLSRFGPEEQDFIGFFKLRIIAMEQPGIIDHIDNQLAEEFRSAKQAATLMAAHRPQLNDEAQAKFNAVWNNVSQRTSIPPDKEAKVRSLFEEVLISSVDLPWACYQHMRLLALNRQQEQALHLVWQRHAGRRSILEMIPLAAPGLPFDDQDRIAAQALETEFNEYESIRGRLIGTMAPTRAIELLNDALARISNLIDHTQFTATSGLDRDFYPSNCFNSWITSMFRGNLERAQVNTSQLRSREIENSIALSLLLNIHDAYHFARFPTANIIHRESIVDGRNDLIPHIDAVRTRLQERLHRDFIELIRNGRIAQSSFLEILGVYSLAEVFGDLESWNPNSDLSALRGLEDDILDNSQITVSMAAIASSLLQAVGYIARTGDENRFPFTRQTVSDHSDYVTLIWQMALRCTNDRENLLLRHTHTRAATSNETSITTRQFDKAFPLDAQPSR